MLIYPATILLKLSLPLWEVDADAGQVDQSRTPKWHDGANEKRGREPRHHALEMFMKELLGILLTVHLI